jgi:hypothetical protein
MQDLLGRGRERPESAVDRRLPAGVREGIGEPLPRRVRIGEDLEHQRRDLAGRPTSGRRAGRGHWEPEQHLSGVVVGAPLHDAERRLEGLVVASHHQLVQPIQVEVLVVDRVRQLVRQHEVLDTVEVGVTGVHELAVL